MNRALAETVIVFAGGLVFDPATPDGTRDGEPCLAFAPAPAGGRLCAG